MLLFGCDFSSFAFFRIPGTYGFFRSRKIPAEHQYFGAETSNLKALIVNVHEASKVQKHTKEINFQSLGKQNFEDFSKIGPFFEIISMVPLLPQKLWICQNRLNKKNKVVNPEINLEIRIFHLSWGCN